MYLARSDPSRRQGRLLVPILGPRTRNFGRCRTRGRGAEWHRSPKASKKTIYPRERGAKRESKSRPRPGRRLRVVVDEVLAAVGREHALPARRQGRGRRPRHGGQRHRRLGRPRREPTSPAPPSPPRAVASPGRRRSPRGRPPATRGVRLPSRSRSCRLCTRPSAVGLRP